ncbi:MAG: zinc dependent phospholipase C family protein [Caloramator sp.]|nr:zinc dependent phospholipase C family protein [Caloramator sp.]
MLSATHKLIGKSILNNIKQYHNIPINEEGFLSGCLKPDYSLPFFFIPHYKEKSFNFIIEMITELINYNFSNNKNTKNFYIKLGIVTHFLCDYFCHAHNNKKLDNMFLHLKYERALHNLFEELSIDKISVYYSQNHNSLKVYSLDSLIDFINDMHQKYISTPPSMEKDIYYALEISNNAVDFIISCIKNCHKYNVA